MKRQPLTRNSLLVAAALAASLIFLLDYAVELGVATGVLYLPVVYLAYLSGSNRAIVIAATACSLLVIAGFLASPTGGVMWMVVTNRALSLFVIWFVAFLTRRDLRLTVQLLDRAKVAERAVDEANHQRAEQRRRSSALASMMEDLQHKSERLLEEVEVRKRAEQSLLQANLANRRLAAIVESSHDAILSTTLEGFITSWNAGAERLYGYTAEEMIGRPASDLAPEHRSNEIFELLNKLRLGEQISDFETERMTRDGVVIEVSLMVSPIRDENQQVIGASAIARDISTIRRAHRRFESAVESAPVAMVMVNAEGKMVLVNRQTEELFGYSRDELVNEPVERLIPHHLREKHPEHRNDFFSNPAVRQMGGGRELFALRKNGRPFPVEIGLNPVEMEDGLHVLSAIVDITERKRSEQQIRRYADQLERSNEELDLFAYSASHDLKAPLRAIDSLAKWIAEDLDDQIPDESRSDLSLMQQRINRMERLLDDLLEYSRVGRVEHDLEEVDVEEMVHDIVQLLAPPPDFEFYIDPLPKLNVYRAPLEQVFRNLINNAVKHHDRPDGRVDVSAVFRGAFVEFSVRDDGPGIAEKYQEQIFGMFKTLKRRDEVEGSGMGLALVKKIVEKHGGRIELQSAESEGTTFRFSWPKSQEANYVTEDLANEV